MLDRRKIHRIGDSRVDNSDDEKQDDPQDRQLIGVKRSGYRHIRQHDRGCRKELDDGLLKSRKSRDTFIHDHNRRIEYRSSKSQGDPLRVLYRSAAGCADSSARRLAAANDKLVQLAPPDNHRAASETAKSHTPRRKQQCCVPFRSILLHILNRFWTCTHEGHISDYHIQDLR
jgi:hypothetical protein